MSSRGSLCVFPMQGSVGGGTRLKHCAWPLHRYWVLMLTHKPLYQAQPHKLEFKHLFLFSFSKQPPVFSFRRTLTRLIMNKTNFLVALEIGKVQDQGVDRSGVEGRHGFWFTEDNISVCFYVVQGLMGPLWASFAGTLILFLMAEVSL